MRVACLATLFTLAVLAGHPSGPAAGAEIGARAPVAGGVVADPSFPRRLRHQGGGPVFLSSVGEPEGFLFRGTLNANGTRSGDQGAIVSEIRARGINLLYVNGFADSRFGGDGPSGANPFVNGNIAGDIDADVLNQWFGWFQTLDAAGVTVYFNIYDDLIDVLAGKRMNWNLSGGNLHPQEQKYVDAVVTRFRPLKHLVWSVNESANKTYPASYVARWKKIAARIRTVDTFRHPIGIGLVGEDDPNVTPNTGIALYATDPNIDLHLVQHVRPTSVADQYNRILSAFNFAAGRYAIMLGQTFHANNGADGRKKNWATAMAGAYIIQAGEQAPRIWSVLRSPDADLNQLGYIARFFEAIPSLNAMVPRSDLNFGNTKYVLAVPGSSYVAYSDMATSNLGVSGLTSGTYDLKWLDTVDGSTVVQNGVAVMTASKTFPRPSTIQAEAALYLAKR